MSRFKILDSSNLGSFFDTIISLVEKFTGKVSGGTLQEQIDQVKEDVKANNYTHPTTSGNKHIPSGGSSGQILRWSADGTAVWGSDNNTTYSPASLGQGYGTCTTAEATTAKVVTLSNYSLVTGGIVAVKFTYAVPANATLNVNSKGAKAIFHKGVAITTGVIKSGDTATFIYNGSQYHLLGVDRDIVDLTEIDAAFEEIFGQEGDKNEYKKFRRSL